MNAGTNISSGLIREPGSPRQLNVIRGQYKVSNNENIILSTILGSCVSACMWDPISGVGGMNHFLLAGDRPDGNVQSLSHGVYAMEVLINGLLKRGAARPHLKAKLFGGAAIMKGLPDIGRQNAAFATDFLEREGIECLTSSLGGNAARRIKFWPAIGRALVLELPPTESAELDEPVDEPPAPSGNDVELF